MNKQAVSKLKDLEDRMLKDLSDLRESTQKRYTSMIKDAVDVVHSGAPTFGGLRFTIEEDEGRNSQCAARALGGVEILWNGEWVDMFDMDHAKPLQEAMDQLNALINLAQDYMDDDTTTILVAA